MRKQELKQTARFRIGRLVLAPDASGDIHRGLKHDQANVEVKTGMLTRRLPDGLLFMELLIRGAQSFAKNTAYLHQNTRPLPVKVLEMRTVQDKAGCVSNGYYVRRAFAFAEQRHLPEHANRASAWQIR